MDSIKYNNKEYFSNEYLEYSSTSGGEISRANILFLLKNKNHSISSLEKPKDTDLLMGRNDNGKKFYLRKELFDIYSKKMKFDPILDVDSVLSIEKKWKREAIKKVAKSLDKDMKNIDENKVRVRSFNLSSVEIEYGDVKKQKNSNKLKF